MTVRGKVKNGKVVLEDPAALAEGTEVEVRPLAKPKKAGRPGRRNKGVGKSLAERFASFIGRVSDLPPDASVHHDHYLYGTPKRK